MRRTRLLLHCLLPAALALGACADSSDGSPDADETDATSIAPIDGSAGAGGEDPADVQPDVMLDTDGQLDTDPDAELDVVQPDTSVDWCRLQFPAEVTLAPGEDDIFFVRVFEEGVTDASNGSDPLEALSVELGWGSDGTDPAAADWTWQAAEPNAAWTDGEELGNDEYVSTLVATDEGEFDVAFRVSLDSGASYLYSDTAQGEGADGAENGYQPGAASQLTVTAPEVCAPNPCTAPPAGACTDSGTVEQYGPTGTCSNVEGAAMCDYVPMIATCETGAACADGACVLPPEFTFCRLQFPLSLTVAPGTENQYFVRFYGEGLTDGSEENDAIDGADVQIGIQMGEPELPVIDDTAWQWFDGASNTMWNGGIGGEPRNDEWQAPVRVDAEGTYRVVARVRASADGAWLYCDGGDPGSTDGVALDFLGVLSVDGESTDLCDPNPCTTPPPAVCGHEFIVLQPSAVGICEPTDGAASCTYPVTFVTCDIGDRCEAGSCVPAASSCDDPLFCANAEPFCSDSVSFVPAGVGACALEGDSPFCSFEYIEEDCTDSDRTCSGGVCVSNSSVDVSFCRLQFPTMALADTRSVTPFYTRVFAVGLTDVTSTTDLYSELRVQTGTLPAHLGQTLGPAVDPALSPLAWDWAEAFANEDYDGTSSGEPNNDEYQADISLDDFGEYFTVSRVSGDSGSTWTYCYAGEAGSTAPFGDGSLGTLSVIPLG
jgi:hypothetical protein